MSASVSTSSWQQRPALIAASTWRAPQRSTPAPRPRCPRHRRRRRRRCRRLSRFPPDRRPHCQPESQPQRRPLALPQAARRRWRLQTPPANPSSSPTAQPSLSPSWTPTAPTTAPTACTEQAQWVERLRADGGGGTDDRDGFGHAIAMSNVSIRYPPPEAQPAVRLCTTPCLGPGWLRGPEQCTTAVTLSLATCIKLPVRVYLPVNAFGARFIT